MSPEQLFGILVALLVTTVGGFIANLWAMKRFSSMSKIDELRTQVAVFQTIMESIPARTKAELLEWLTNSRDETRKEADERFRATRDLIHRELEEHRVRCQQGIIDRISIMRSGLVQQDLVPLQDNPYAFPKRRDKRQP